MLRKVKDVQEKSLLQLKKNIHTEISRVRKLAENRFSKVKADPDLLNSIRARVPNINNVNDARTAIRLLKKMGSGSKVEKEDINKIFFKNAGLQDEKY